MKFRQEFEMSANSRNTYSEVESMWVDDEFATKGHVADTCMDKALEARREIIKSKMEYEESFYNAYFS